MKIVTFENPPLSLNPKRVVIEQQENGWHYKIYADGYEIAMMLYRNGFGFANTSTELTDEDRGFLIAAASTLL